MVTMVRMVMVCVGVFGALGCPAQRNSSVTNASMTKSSVPSAKTVPPAERAVPSDEQEELGEWWEAGDAACPDGGKLEKVLTPDFRWFVCKLGGVGHGRWTVLYADYRGKEEGEYRNSKKHGYWTFWNRQGKITKVEHWEDGKLLKTETK
jgi:hypothetical protein